MKIRANASRVANRSDERLVADILKEAEETDRWEDGLFGADRGDEVPEHLRTEEGRRAAFKAAKERLAKKASRTEQHGVARIEPDPEQFGATRGWGRARGTVRLTRTVPRRSRSRVPTSVTSNRPSAPRCARLEDAGVTRRPETVLADAGYWHTRQMENIVSDGIQVLVPPDAGLREGARPGWDKGAYAFMRRVLSSEAGHALYKYRKATVDRCSLRTSSTAGSVASSVEAEPRCARSGACRRQSTTC